MSTWFCNQDQVNVFVCMDTGVSVLLQSPFRPLIHPDILLSISLPLRNEMPIRVGYNMHFPVYLISMFISFASFKEGLLMVSVIPKFSPECCL